MAFQKTKTDPNLGLAVHKNLLVKGIETPGVNSGYRMDRKEQIEFIEEKFREIMTQGLGLDLRDDSLIETPKRVAKMFINEIFWGLEVDAFPKATTVDNKMNYDEMVCERNIIVQSFCEHHLLPINGGATVAYIPNKKVLGLSKMNRIVEYFSRRPQIQERLTQQIALTLQFILETDNVAVLIDAKHDCVRMRGVSDPCSDTVTNFLGGCFKTDFALRSEFMSIATAGLFKN
jgi:GTP cyclohydrolase I